MKLTKKPLFWTVSGVLLTAVGVFVAVMQWSPWEQGDENTTVAAATTEAVAQASTPTPTHSEAEAVEMFEAQPETVVDSGLAGQTSGGETFYLANLDDDSIVREPRYGIEPETVTMNGDTFVNSLTYDYRFCSSKGCEATFLEFIVPGDYDQLTGTFGLSDNSRHDDEVDGVLYFSVYDGSGNRIHGPESVEYPNVIPVEIDISNNARLTIEISGGHDD